MPQANNQLIVSIPSLFGSMVKPAIIEYNNANDETKSEKQSTLDAKKQEFLLSAMSRGEGAFIEASTILFEHFGKDEVLSSRVNLLKTMYVVRVELSDGKLEARGLFYTENSAKMFARKVWKNQAPGTYKRIYSYSEVDKENAFVISDMSNLPENFKFGAKQKPVLTEEQKEAKKEEQIKNRAKREAKYPQLAELRKIKDEEKEKQEEEYRRKLQAKIDTIKSRLVAR